MRLQDVLDSKALRGYLNWKYYGYPYHIQLQKHHSDSKITFAGKCEGGSSS